MSSEVFARPERIRRFLKFVVEETVAGRPVNEYRIAVEVYDRKSSFDPADDSIVRVEVSRLRQKLGDYYRTEGRNRPLVIEVPPRTYVPSFHASPQPSARVPDPAPDSSAPATPSALDRQPYGRGQLLRERRFALTIGVFVLFAALCVAALAWLASGVRSARRAGGNAPAISIAVLPFADLSRTKDQAYLGDELSEEIIHALSRIPGINVASRTSSFAHAGKSEDIRVIGRELNATAVVEGSIRIHDGRWRIAAQLIDIATGYHIWSETYERSAQGTFGVEQEIAAGIATALRRKLVPNIGDAVRRHAPKLETYSLYLEAMHYGKQWSAESLSKAIELLERAVAADPDYAAAWAALAETRTVLAIHAGFPPDVVMPQAKTEAMKALGLDDTLPLGHSSLGLVNGLYEWRWADAQRELERGHDLAPADAAVHEAYIMGYLLPAGQFGEALRQANEALAIDPASTRITSICAMVHMFRNEPDQALALLEKTLRLDPDFLTARLAMGSAYAGQGKFDDAIREIRAGRGAWDSGVGRSALACVYARMGKTAEARSLLTELVELSKRRYISAVYIAQIYLALGDRASALDWLNRAYGQRASGLAFLKVNPRFDALRADPRFVALLSRIGLN